MELTRSLAKRRMFVGVAAAVLASAIAIFTLDSEGKADPPTSATSVILISGDGMGVQQRTAIQYAGYGLDERQPMDALPYAGFLDTIQDGNTAVTDSAAGATAWSIGIKTKNGLVGLGRDKVRVPTLLEIAEAEGKATGIVNDHDVTNATLASFASPIKNRDWKNLIAKRTLRGTSPDVMMGGGERYWYPKGDPGMIPDEVPDEDQSTSDDNLVEEAIGMGYQYAYDRETVDDLTGPKALALVQDSGLQRYKELKGYKPNEDPNYVKHPVLFEKALEILSQDPDGFFLVTESDDMDSAAHEHDGENVIKTGMNINKMVEIVEEFRLTNPDVLLIVTADHETGGMTIENTSETNTNSNGDDPVPYFGDGSKNFAGPNGEVPPKSGPFEIKGTDRMFKVDWTTPEHTGGYVPVTASGPLAEELTGVHHNTHVYDVISQVLTTP